MGLGIPTIVSGLDCFFGFLFKTETENAAGVFNHRAMDPVYGVRNALSILINGEKKIYIGRK